MAAYAASSLAPAPGNGKHWPHDGPIGRRTCGYIRMMDQSDACRASIFTRWTNQTQDVRGHMHIVIPSAPTPDTVRSDPRTVRFNPPYRPL
eukprot:1187344-Prorocentrum_minimum.AAC.1